MSAFIVNADRQRIREVKNLGWLLKHWKDVDNFVIDTDGSITFMTANLKNGNKFETQWVSYTVCRSWLARPVFLGVNLEIRTGTKVDNIIISKMDKNYLIMKF